MLIYRIWAEYPRRIPFRFRTLYVWSVPCYRSECCSMQCHCYHCSVVGMEAVAHICIQSKKTMKIKDWNSFHRKRKENTIWLKANKNWSHWSWRQFKFSFKIKSHARDRAAAAAGAHTYEHRAVHFNDCDEIISIKIVQFLCSPFHFCLSGYLLCVLHKCCGNAAQSFSQISSHLRAHAHARLFIIYVNRRIELIT